MASTTPATFIDDSGEVRFSGTLSTSGTSTGNQTVTGTLHVTGATTLDSTLLTSGAATFAAGLSHTGTTLGFLNTTATTKQAVTGALTTVIDAPAKAVLTSIIAALHAYGLITDSTT